ncbi:hypothetical protein SKAU_G00053100 [Synaphobranchus kaupii]|uniref:G-protein coupled receptors family 1 profile domain-containing protein n=1 Tax=Synaphobranchus kaupii TaxID=118154 RepID=A0A9Q1J9Z1_SYNKA|nr:hypothetical protein SKAU_G00053100 [Synaphobranchus kaupii]
MSAERYLAISHPYTYKRWAVDQHVARWCLFAIYAGNVLFCCLPLLGFIACNVALCWTLLIMRQRTRRLAPRASIKKHWRERSSGVEIQMMLLLIVTSLVVLVCSTPLVVRIFVNQTWLVYDWDADLQAIRFASVNPILDPMGVHPPETYSLP